ncbi:MAG TPA: hypothetical protein IAA04_08860 [Candidatus Lachnoclostridium pullistercoris]|uniref:Uncharacterized protein n=1 Tax=Candidatus Lachnoclostridium pullistercoris TaxID=2838632 RepID=A0A9D2PDP5_9FIRM|nr:hypothetical protein [Candidatus Lachnoclostridium pullistercoris]
MGRPDRRKRVIAVLAAAFIAVAFLAAQKSAGLKFFFNVVRSDLIELALIFAAFYGLRRLRLEQLVNQKVRGAAYCQKYLDYSSKVSSANTILALCPENTGVQTIGQ